MKYGGAGRENPLSIGAYRDLSLGKARERRDKARRLLADQIDPSARKKAERQVQANTFEAVAREWLELQRRGRRDRQRSRLTWSADKRPSSDRCASRPAPPRATR